MTLDRERQEVYNLQVTATDNPEGTANQRRTSIIVSSLFFFYSSFIFCLKLLNWDIINTFFKLTENKWKFSHFMGINPLFVAPYTVLWFKVNNKKFKCSNFISNHNPNCYYINKIISVFLNNVFHLIKTNYSNFNYQISIDIVYTYVYIKLIKRTLFKKCIKWLLKKGGGVYENTISKRTFKFQLFLILQSFWAIYVWSIF